MERETGIGPLLQELNSTSIPVTLPHKSSSRKKLAGKPNAQESFVRSTLRDLWSDGTGTLLEVVNLEW